MLDIGTRFLERAPKEEGQCEELRALCTLDTTSAVAVESTSALFVHLSMNIDCTASKSTSCAAAEPIAPLPMLRPPQLPPSEPYESMQLPPIDMFQHDSLDQVDQEDETSQASLLPDGHNALLQTHNGECENEKDEEDLIDNDAEPTGLHVLHQQLMKDEGDQGFWPNFHVSARFDPPGFHEDHQQHFGLADNKSDDGLPQLITDEKDKDGPTNTTVEAQKDERSRTEWKINECSGTAQLVARGESMANIIVVTMDLKMCESICAMAKNDTEPAESGPKTKKRKVTSKSAQLNVREVMRRHIEEIMKPIKRIFTLQATTFHAFRAWLNKADSESFQKQSNKITTLINDLNKPKDETKQISETEVIVENLASNEMSIFIGQYKCSVDCKKSMDLLSKLNSDDMLKFYCQANVDCFKTNKDNNEKRITFNKFCNIVDDTYDNTKSSFQKNLPSIKDIEKETVSDWPNKAYHNRAKFNRAHAGSYVHQIALTLVKEMCKFLLLKRGII